LKPILFRIRVRAACTTLSLILFPVFFYYLSPVIPMMGGSQGIVTGSLIVFLVLFLSAAFLGRGFCSYVCPGGAIQDSVCRTGCRPFNRSARWIKWLVWGSWLVGLAFLFRRAGGVRGIRFAFGTHGGVSVSDVSSLIAYTMVVLVFFILPLLFGRRAACHTVCWMAPFLILGRGAGRTLGLPSLRVRSEPESCVSCGRCDAVCPMSLPVSRQLAAGEIASSDCILCGLCVDTCGRKTLKFAWR
jgi:ferredoxin-type protein NapH